ncbi:MAG: iron-containing alcohol dehydrogenase [Pseudomonadota bacterium]
MSSAASGIGANAPRISPWSATSVTDLHFGVGRVGRIAEDAAALCPADKAILIVADGILEELGSLREMRRALEGAGARVAVYDAVAGDPKEAQVDAAAELARATDAGLVICIGGGAALDLGKLAACVAGERDAVARDFALCARAFPMTALPKICIPTTAGTGSEVTRTSIVSGEDGAKLWHWGEALLPRYALLDPLMTVTLPPHLTAWTGLDAATHAIEAATNRWSSPAARLYAHEALRQIDRWLPTAVDDPENLTARSKALWGATLAGLALHLASASLAHSMSHALASLGPAHHGHATALALEIVLPWQAEAEDPDAEDPDAEDAPFEGVAEAIGVSRAELGAWFSNLIDRCGVERRLDRSFSHISPEALAAAMSSPANRPMVDASVRSPSASELRDFSARLLAFAA